MSKASTTAKSEVAECGVRPRPTLVTTGEIYGIDEAKARLGWSNSAFRAAKRRGLRLLVCGKRRYVTGSEILRFLESIQDPK